MLRFVTFGSYDHVPVRSSYSIDNFWRIFWYPGLQLIYPVEVFRLHRIVCAMSKPNIFLAF
jgi:hypothetical protein